MVGPQYETEAEINAIERLGGEVVGMTMPREAKLSAEPGAVAALLIATNWAAGRHRGDATKALSHDEVSRVVEAHRHHHDVSSTCSRTSA